jgi:hypothetical protein
MRTAISQQCKSGSMGDEPTTRQMRCLRALTEITGTTFATPRTRREASLMIAAMHRRRHSPRVEIRTEGREITSAMRSHKDEATRVRPHELRGHGSTAAWCGH